MFTGVITALVTPMRGPVQAQGGGSGGFADRGGEAPQIDEAALIELVERQIAAGIDGLVPCGTTGESPTLSTEEHLRVIEVVVKAARKRVPVIAGAGSNSTAEAIALSVAARERGADGLLHVTPYYNRPTQEGLYQHFRAIAAAAGLPIVLYNVPTRTSVDLLPETVERLAALPHVVAIKEATGSIPRTQAIVARCPELAVLGGDDATAFALYAVGARGVISVVSNVAPREIAEQWDHVAAGRWAEARAVNQRVMLPLADVLFAETNPIAVKAAMAMQQQCSAELRLPLTPASAPVAEKVRATLTALRLL